MDDVGGNALDARRVVARSPEVCERGDLGRFAGGFEVGVGESRGVLARLQEGLLAREPASGLSVVGLVPGVLGLFVERVGIRDAAARSSVEQLAPGEKLACSPAVLASGLDVPRRKAQARLPDPLPEFGIDGDVVLVAERAVVGEELDEKAFAPPCIGDSSSTQSSPALKAKAQGMAEAATSAAP